MAVVPFVPMPFIPEDAELRIANVTAGPGVLHDPAAAGAVQCMNNPDKPAPSRGEDL